MRRSVATQVGAAAVTLAGMVATPLASQRGSVRRCLSSAVVGGLAVTTASASLRRWGAGRTSLTVASSLAATTMVEHLGQRSGRPFGRYSYTPALQPQLGDLGWMPRSPRTLLKSKRFFVKPH